MKIQRIFGVVLVVTMVSLICADFAFAQRGGRRGAGRMMGMMMAGGQNNDLALLADDNVRTELELVDEQIEDLEKIQEKATKMMQDMFAELQDLPAEERGEAFRGLREKIGEKMEPIQSEIKDILLPHQHDRLKQLGFQNSGRGQGAGGALLSDNVIEELGISDEQKEELEEAIEEAREKLKKEYQKLVKDAEDDILKVLDSDQRKQYRELVGEPFQFQERQRNTRGQRGGRGNRGDRGDGERDRGK